MDADRDASAPQLSLDGREERPQEPEELPGYMQDRGRAEQPRLFQPQLEGQLALGE